MAIAASDLKLKLSIKTGAAGNAAAQPDVNESLGKYISTTEVTDATLNNLFDDVSGVENAASDVEYRCLFLHNAHATLTWTSVKIWLSAEVSGGTSIALAVDDAVDSAIGGAPAQAEEIATESDAPTDVGSFSSPTTYATGLAMGDIAPGYCRAFWVKRTAANTVAVDNDGMTVSYQGDSTA
jgi:hypothetical protein